ncbi:MAG: bifunctional UDP-N-acetylmuramoyl-tripeptide:D-alanyl-D-alanine ligase/alanine racemase [Saprospiraceae bacterium]|nr:bifunctional UDP-N-acetylmuramoyl-tripeptide:D-alanyl-D-alanine ligase/alanine racemase [Saprospiraceae bacterium]
MMYTAIKISEILGTDKSLLQFPNALITRLSIDTRKIDIPEETIFFALSGSMHDGNEFIQDALDKGIRNIVSENTLKFSGQKANVFQVNHGIQALQKLTTFHRNQFKELKVIGIIGSNGKTTIKEWLFQMLHDRQVVKSPKSYNSQTGVPLSVWQINEHHELGIFEAGISQRGEMANLAETIKPTIGLFTMIGDAHAEGFSSLSEKLNEKLLFFETVQTIVFNEDDSTVSTSIRTKFVDRKLLSWGRSKNASLFRVIAVQRSNYRSDVTISINQNEYVIVIPFSDSASIDNALHCVAILIILGKEVNEIKQEILKLQNIPMRLELKNGIHNSILINDTYNADVQSFKIALEFLSQQSGTKEKILILSDFVQTGLDEETLNIQLANLIRTHRINYVVGIGQQVKGLVKYLDPHIVFSFFTNIDDFIEIIPGIDISNKAILVKGARVFQLEKVIRVLSDKAHSATLEIDLQSIEHNLKVFSNQLSPDTQIIAVIKASAYGSGSEELARFLEFKKVGYLAVAFVDEGVQLRQAGVSLPIIILNPDSNGIQEMVTYKLEPEVYSMDQLREIISIIDLDENKHFYVHIKVDTGMHRLGFMQAELNDLGILLASNVQIRVKSIFSHLSSSEDASDDEFTHNQVKAYIDSYKVITEFIGYMPLKHILNSAGIIRFPQYHFDLVRLGLGLYGIDTTETIAGQLEKVHTLKATIVQIKTISASEYIGYNRRGRSVSGGKIAIINIGYADGLMRMAGNGRYKVEIHGKEYPVIGNVCMDLTIIDIGHADDVYAGDEAVIFGKGRPVEELAKVCQTIPYEILSRISGRVRRLYIQG